MNISIGHKDLRKHFFEFMYDIKQYAEILQLPHSEQFIVKTIGCSSRHSEIRSVFLRLNPPTTFQQLHYMAADLNNLAILSQIVTNINYENNNYLSDFIRPSKSTLSWHELLTLENCLGSAVWCLE